MKTQRWQRRGEEIFLGETVLSAVGLEADVGLSGSTDPDGSWRDKLNASKMRHH